MSFFNFENCVYAARWLQRRSPRLLVTFNDWDSKKWVFSAKRDALKNTNYFIDHDLTMEDAHAAKRIRDVSRRCKGLGIPFKKGFNALWINNNKYTFDPLNRDFSPSLPAHLDELEHQRAEPPTGGQPHVNEAFQPSDADSGERGSSVNTLSSDGDPMVQASVQQQSLARVPGNGMQSSSRVDKTALGAPPVAAGGAFLRPPLLSGQGPQPRPAMPAPGNHRPSTSAVRFQGGPANLPAPALGPRLPQSFAATVTNESRGHANVLN